MTEPPPTSYSPLFEGLAVWLQRHGLREMPLEDIAQEFGRRLVQGGLSLHRTSLGGMVLHPVFGALDIVWDAQHDSVRRQTISRRHATTETFRNSPFFYLASNAEPFLHERMDRPPIGKEFPLYENLRAEGITDYFAFFQSYERTGEVMWADLPPGLEGVLGSFATRRLGGFTDDEIAYLKALSLPLALTVKSSSTYALARELLETFLGKLSGGHVLDGLIERGDGRLINSVLWYCDLRDSTGLADRMPLDDYLGTINAYFDCTAGAVMDHGGEVLKFIGDAVMAIFPINEETRPASDMCRAAMLAAREAHARAGIKNAERREKGLPSIEFGVALHVGQVMYGNVGTERRLDFTVIGPAANEATRLENLCKKLSMPIVASEIFKRSFPGEMRSLGRHAAPGLDGDLDAYTLADEAIGGSR